MLVVTDGLGNLCCLADFSNARQMDIMFRKGLLTGVWRIELYWL